MDERLRAHRDRRRDDDEEKDGNPERKVRKKVGQADLPLARSDKDPGQAVDRIATMSFVRCCPNAMAANVTA
jgi:hypothetical protein